ncbi:MAG: oxygen-dependent coproporphyrinogen oxidase [Bacteroidetes bacterium SW_11_45_7]|nr:MAG: oxygen-dependent coproporphyrinogen oxidase [Bacteroidetes bacterium SW_11_45_7]
MDKEPISDFFYRLQDEICQELEELDAYGRFHEDTWERDGGGGGRTRVLTKGDVIEKGGVNFSKVYGQATDKIRESIGVNGNAFFASGLSIVLHPYNPFVPTIHMNIRYFEMDDGNAWFGGGIDLTPHYIDKSDAARFHQHLKKVCDDHHPTYYPAFKHWADDYFFIKHRNETRGIGGIFFDRLAATEDISLEDRYAFVKDVGEAFMPVYKPLVDKHRNDNYSETQKDWQLIRRGRYVEFNLVYDRGTRFGLDSGGRIESILMSLPEYASWQYNFQPEEGSAEAETQQWLQKHIDWLALLDRPTPDEPIKER